MEAGGFQLNDYIFKQNCKMVIGRRNRNEKLWENGEAEEVGKQEKALKWHAEITEPYRRGGGDAELPEATARAAIRSSGCWSSRTRTTNLKEPSWLPNGKASFSENQ